MTQTSEWQRHERVKRKGLQKLEKFTGTVSEYIIPFLRGVCRQYKFRYIVKVYNFPLLDSNELTFVLWPILWNDTGTTPLLSKNISLEMVYQYIFWYKSLLHVDKNWRIEIKTEMNV